ncbi:Hsp20/alpha crystallin family protein [Flavitalea sp. BT771]|uniref:Hsp20/alpha crystallin family protein n=1 Tax=Flavitalea sp. BT771 TaxID=3063329 RepID=UPI0026E36AAD|nr:Hsp20/alpha crystallin family protein [Flavitalea sp. BT771]MDO6429010.1 Hsp20/alpha crystallin family protein [Flavitalea sp. BT771]MDV6218862.1 Hsp20/alpha crystallin family protein [Flavitalea sp. BT771]
MTNIIKKENRQPATFGSVVDQIFHNNLSRFFEDTSWGFNGLQARNQVPVNIRETDKTYEMEIIAPGLRKEDFQLNLAGDLLTVSFDHKEEKEGENKETGWLRKEYGRRSFSRSFTVDDTVDVEQAAARYQDGILYVSLPKKEHAQQLSRTIQIQ